jgi:archaellum component FlaC
VSKPSIANKVEANEENTRLSVIDKKLKKVNTKVGGNDPNTSMQEIQETARVQDIQQKLQKAKKETQDLKFELQKKNNDLEQRDKKINELESLVNQLKQYGLHQQSNISNSQNEA